MEINGWIGAYRVRAFPWVDGKRIYFNVQEYAPGQSLERPPALDKTVYITDDKGGRRLVFGFTHSLAEYVLNMKIRENTEVTLSVPTDRPNPSDFLCGYSWEG